MGFNPNGKLRYYGFKILENSICFLVCHIRTNVYKFSFLRFIAGFKNELHFTKTLKLFHFYMIWQSVFLFVEMDGCPDMQWNFHIKILLHLTFLQLYFSGEYFLHGGPIDIFWSIVVVVIQQFFCLLEKQKYLSVFNCLKLLNKNSI